MIHASCKWLSKWLGDVDGGPPQRLARRIFLASALVPAFAAQKAEVSGFDLSLLDEAATPNDLFYVCAHFPTPSVTASGWMLAVKGAVSKPIEIPFDDLSARPRKSWEVTLESAENPVGGGLISHAEWTGIPLQQLLDAAKPAIEASAVRLSGADGFSRIISLAKARHPDTFLALTMNGEKLPVNHGFPVRAIIPGWYGTDSVKWLRGIEVLTGDPPPQDYSREVRALIGGRRRTDPVTAMNVKSTFSRPLDGAILFGKRFILRGAAWAGENRVRSVEVSVDGAKSWKPAKLAAASKPYAWVGWSLEWNIPAPGSYELLLTATDDKGRQQPTERAFDRVDDYEWNQRQLIKVTVS